MLSHGIVKKKEKRVKRVKYVLFLEAVLLTVLSDTTSFSAVFWTVEGPLASSRAIQGLLTKLNRSKHVATAESAIEKQQCWASRMELSFKDELHSLNSLNFHPPRCFF